jgi:hypothetical protein
MSDGEKEDEIFVDEDVLKILRDSLKVKLQNERKFSDTAQLKSSIGGVLSEFLSCFKIMGYDFDGNPVEMSVIHNRMEKSAIDNMFVQSFGVFINEKINRGEHFD